MNVLYLINYAGKAGTEKYVENLVRILSVDKINPYFCYNIEGELSVKMKAKGVPCFQLDMGKKNIFKAAKKLAEYCRDNKIDVIHAQYPRENIIALMSKKYYYAPKCIMTAHLTLELSGASGFIWKRLNSHFTPKNHRIISVCNEGKDIMLKNNVDPEKITVIFNGIEPSGRRLKPTEIRQELGISDDCFVMTILARYAPEKGLGFLVDSIEKLKKNTLKPFCCIICGDGDLFEDIKTKIENAGLENEFRLVGYRTDTKKILLSSDIYLCSSQCNEAMSFAILEAMDAGLPLVVTDVGGNRDLAENRIKCGYVVDYGNSDEFSNRILNLIDNQETRDKLSNAALEKVKKYFDLNKLANDVYLTYK